MKHLFFCCSVLGMFYFGCGNKTPIESPVVANMYSEPQPKKYLGMSIAEFSTKRNVEAMENLYPEDPNEFLVLIETVEQNPVHTIQYQFADQKLYEIIFSYDPSIDLQAKVESEFGKPNLPEGRWRVEAKGTHFYVWIHNNNLCFGEVSHFPSFEPKE